MCGFYASLTKEKSYYSPKFKKTVLESFKWRGPDSQGEWLDQNIILLHNRLSILDLSDKGHQPMVCKNGRYVVAFNGEIYNWKEIRKTLRKKDWVSKTDTETLLYSFIELGKDCLAHLNGMFSFVIWDKKKKELFVARDRLGIKPLYYNISTNKVSFSSEIKTLLTAGVENTINLKTVNDYLRWGVIDHSTNTFFKNICQLKAGHFATINLKSFSIKIDSYWDLYTSVKNKALLSPQDAARKFDHLLRDSIGLQIQADVDVGICLSGGVDSSVLTAIASDMTGGKNLKSFTYFFEGGGGEEAIARSTAKQLGIENIGCELKSSEVPSYIKKVLFHQESPVTSMRVLALHRLYEVCKLNNIKVLLEGAGGDEMAAGYEYYYLPHIIDMLENSSTKDVLNELEKYMNRFNVQSEMRLERLIDCLKTTLVPGVSTQDGVSFVSNNFFNAEFLEEYSRPIFSGHFNDWLRSSQLIDLSHVVLPKALRYADRASMAASCEARVPMLDHRIVEMAFQTSHQARMENGQQRIFMRSAAESILSDKLLHKPKQTIVDPQRSWLKNELNEWIRDTVDSISSRKLGFLNIPKIIESYDDYCNDEKPRTSAHIFQILNIINWYEVFYENGI